MVTQKIRAIEDDQDGGWVAEVVGLPGCMSQGETEAEAIANTLQAFSEVAAAGGAA